MRTTWLCRTLVRGRCSHMRPIASRAFRASFTLTPLAPRMRSSHSLHRSLAFLPNPLRLAEAHKAKLAGCKLDRREHRDCRRQPRRGRPMHTSLSALTCRLVIALELQPCSCGGRIIALRLQSCPPGRSSGRSIPLNLPTTGMLQTLQTRRGGREKKGGGRGVCLQLARRMVAAERVPNRQVVRGSLIDVASCMCACKWALRLARVQQDMDERFGLGGGQCFVLPFKCTRRLSKVQPVQWMKKQPMLLKRQPSQWMKTSRQPGRGG